jgi:hypothetical protein
MAEELDFLRTLEGFLNARGETLRIPMIGGKQLDLHTLYREVTNRGGFQ